MFDGYSSSLARRGAVAITALSLATVACGYNHEKPVAAKAAILALPANRAELPRCYSDPLPSEEAPLPSDPPLPPVNPNNQAAESAYLAASGAWNAQINAFNAIFMPPETTIPVENGLASGDPITLIPNIQTTVNNAIVQVSGGGWPESGWKGSGFLTTDSRGHEVVVTAGHVVAPHAMSELLVTDNAGKTAQVVGGCFIFEDKGAFTSPDLSEHGVEKDIAVLRLGNALGSGVLSIATSAPSRGQWTFFENYQGDANPGAPYSYTGLVVESPASAFGLMVLTGLEGFSTPDIAKALEDVRRVQPGASGGPVVIANGQVVGISDTALANRSYLDANSVYGSYKVRFPGAVYGPDSGFMPTDSHLMSPAIIRKALQAPAA